MLVVVRALEEGERIASPLLRTSRGCVFGVRAHNVFSISLYDFFPNIFFSFSLWLKQRLVIFVFSRIFFEVDINWSVTSGAQIFSMRVHFFSVFLSFVMI